MTTHSKSAPFSPSLGQLQAALNENLFGGGEPVVVAIKGGWGEGKTYFWKNKVVVSRCSTDVEPGYVSVFGAESLSAIQRNVVVEAIRTRPKGKTGETLRRTIETTFPYLQATKGVLNAIGGKFGFTTDTFTVPPELLQRVVLRKGWTVCLDDIERLPTNIELDALFGYISALRDEYRVNVALIYNEEKIPTTRTEALKRYAEKAVDREFTFAPKTEEIVELVFKDTISDLSRHELAEKCEKLGLRNIRILSRVKRYYEDVTKVLPKSPEPEYLSAVLWSLLLFSWVKFASVDAKDLTLAFLEQHQGIWDKNEQQEKDWRQVLLENYPYVYSDELDRALIRFVDSSILESRIMLDHYEKFVLEKKRERAGQRLDRAWEHFHNSFGDKETEFGDELFTVIRDEMEFIPIYRMDSALVELERMGRSGDAQALLEQLGKRHSERLAAYDDFSGKLRCQSLISLVEEAKRKAAIDKRPLREVIANALTERNGLLRPRDAARLAQFSEDDFFAYFSSTESPGLTTTLRNLIKATSIRDSTSYDAVVNQILRKVAQRLAQTSPMNRSRIEAMGLLEENPANPVA